MSNSKVEQGVLNVRFTDPTDKKDKRMVFGTGTPRIEAQEEGDWVFVRTPTRREVARIKEHLANRKGFLFELEPSYELQVFARLGLQHVTHWSDADKAWGIIRRMSDRGWDVDVRRAEETIQVTHMGHSRQLTTRYGFAPGADYEEFVEFVWSILHEEEAFS